jgi:16S rRNA (guanine966-N2)-methyltransferase
MRPGHLTVTTRISGGSHKGRLIRTPAAANLRPTSERVRSAIFSIIGPEAVLEKRVLDLYAGTGVLGIEALSRGAAWADFVERNGRLCNALRKLLRQLSLESNATVVQSQVSRAWPALAGGYDLVFADPPYDSDEIGKLASGFQIPGLIAEGGLVVVEYRAGSDPIEPTDALIHVTDRRYGDTAITVLKAGTVDA